LRRVPVASILVVDDEGLIRTLLRIILEAEGYEVRLAKDGDEALMSYKERPADLVLTDILMPGRSGLEVVTELRREYPAVKIIAMSGGGAERQMSFLAEAEMLGADSGIAKPFDNERLLQIVASLLDES
jgi:CheY-like chemotaxis protein